ncbi:MAG: GFA family protein [Pseudoclavibacter sp.]
MSTTETRTESTGHCLCGAISYRFTGEPQATLVCHCGHCQRHTGSAFSVNVLVPRETLEITGTPKSHQTTGVENGHLRDRYFCGDCGTPILTQLHENPDVMIVKAGTLDDPNGLQPTAEVWWRRHQDWVDSDAPLPRFDGDREQD